MPCTVVAWTSRSSSRSGARRCTRQSSSIAAAQWEAPAPTRCACSEQRIAAPRISYAHTDSLALHGLRLLLSAHDAGREGTRGEPSGDGRRLTEPVWSARICRRHCTPADFSAQSDAPHEESSILKNNRPNPIVAEGRIVATRISCTDSEVESSVPPFASRLATQSIAWIRLR
jgi:hypothetical protein